MYIENINESTCCINIRDDEYVVWNRFRPVFAKVSKLVVKKILENDLDNDEMSELENYNISNKPALFQKEQYFNEIINDLDQLDSKAISFYEKKVYYGSLKISNSNCNLICPYCIFTHDGVCNSQISRTNKFERLKPILDQYYQNMIKNNEKKTRISFNGGEILLDWETIKRTVGYIKRHYGGVETEYQMNTNLTLLNEEIAAFLKDNNFSVSISIDGNKSLHNKTRIYKKNNSGSFEDVLKAVKLFNKFNKKPIETFQGTIDLIDKFDYDELEELVDMGLKSARLAPNLLNVEKGEGVKRANFIYQLVKNNSESNLFITEDIFSKFFKSLNAEEYKFNKNCYGLSPHHKYQAVNYNIDTTETSLLCSFATKASCTLDNLDNNIFNVKLFVKAKEYIKDRYLAMKKNCGNCEIVGICKGGCIYDGIDRYNNMNDEACDYQRELFRLSVNHLC